MQQTTEKHQFIIRITPSSLSFALREPTGQDIAFDVYDLKKGMSMEANLREAFRTSHLLMTAGDRATVIIDSPVLLIPVDDYDRNEAAEQYHYVYPGQTGMDISAFVLPSFKNVALFSVSKDLRSVLSDHFQEIRYEPLMSRLWDFLLQRSVGSNNKKLYAYFHDEKMEVCSFSHNRFVFANTFDIKDCNDALYFLLGIWKQIDANGNTDDLFLAGRIPQKEAFLDDAKQFLRRVYCINPSADFNRATATQIVGMPLDMMLHLV